MRMMMKVSIPTETGNKAVKEGTIAKIIGQWSEMHKPEAAYFVAQNGERCAYFFLDIKDASDIPSISEPFFMGLNARIEATPAMNPQDLKMGLDKLKM
ncbi:MAG: hypothetical protein ACRELY_21420 [Polyangiaceae bacterium]